MLKKLSNTEKTGKEKYKKKDLMSALLVIILNVNKNICHKNTNQNKVDISWVMSDGETLWKEELLDINKDISKWWKVNLKRRYNKPQFVYT